MAAANTRGRNRKRASGKATGPRNQIGGQARTSASRGTPMTLTVKSASAAANGLQRHLTLVSLAGKETALKVHRMALVGPDDKVHVDPANSFRVSVTSTEDPNDLIPVTPHFERRKLVRLGAIDYDVRVKEITTQSDLEEYDYLEGFHYKTSSAIVAEEADPSKDRTGVGGRKAVLLAYLQVGRRLLPAGYIELQMPLLMVKPRHVLFANGFRILAVLWCGRSGTFQACATT